MTADDTAVLHLPSGDQELPIKAATEGSSAFDIGKLLSGTGYTTLDSGYGNTAACSSAITYIDGDAGILRYRGYPIDQLAEHSSFLEVSYLLIYGELPTQTELDEFTDKIRRHTLLHEDLKAFFNGFPRDAHPMPVLSSAVSALSTFYQDSLDPFNADDVELSTVRLLAKLPTIAAYAYKKSIGQPFLYPDNSLGLVENFLRMTFGFPAEPYEVDPEIARALDILLILHADHEQNCSTSTVRMVGSSQANLFASISAGINALFGPLHGGANQAVLEMLQKIQNEENGDVENYVKRVKNKEDKGARLMGFGHRVYKNYDPRAKIVKQSADEILKQHRGQRPAAGHRQGPRGEGAGRRLLHRAQALPERRLLHRRDLPRDGLPDQDVHRAVRARPAAGLDRALARDDQRPHHEDRPPAPAVRRRDGAQLPGALITTRCTGPWACSQCAELIPAPTSSWWSTCRVVCVMWSARSTCSMARRAAWQSTSGRTSTCADSAGSPEVISQMCRSCTSTTPVDRGQVGPDPVGVDAARRGLQEDPAGLSRSSAQPALIISAATTSAAMASARAKPVVSTTSPATAVAMNAYRSLRMCWNAPSTFRLVPVGPADAPRGGDVDHDPDQRRDQHRARPRPAGGRSAVGRPRSRTRRPAAAA